MGPDPRLELIDGEIFEMSPMKGLFQKPAYYSIRIKVDTQIKFSLWDDFLLKRIEIEQ